MTQETTFETCEGIVVPAPVLLQRQPQNPYGSVEGLSDEELADPAELERQVVIREFGPLLALPKRPGSCGQRRGWAWDADRVDDRFDSIDFLRERAPFDRARYKADKLREELRDVAIRLSIVNERVPGKAKYPVLKQLSMGAIELDHVLDEDLWALGRLHLRAQRLRREIREIEERRRARQARQLNAWLAALGD